MLRSLNTALLIASAAALVACFWNRNALPRAIVFDPSIDREPRQAPIHEAPRTLSFAGVSYRVEPLFDYELDGLVVSYREHDGESAMHKWSNDHLNVADVCVVWSDTARSPHLTKLDFWSGIFTCNVATRDGEAWASFRMNQLANNHLLSVDPAIRARVGEIRVGDQIRVRGWLARYGAVGNQALRGTSTTRDDSGDGACETILVHELEIVRHGRSGWRAGLWIALAVLLATLAVHFALPYRPYRG